MAPTATSRSTMFSTDNTWTCRCAHTGRCRDQRKCAGADFCRIEESTVRRERSDRDAGDHATGSLVTGSDTSQVPAAREDRTRFSRVRTKWVAPSGPVAARVDRIVAPSASREVSCGCLFRSVNICGTNKYGKNDNSPRETEWRPKTKYYGHTTFTPGPALPCMSIVLSGITTDQF